MSFWCGFALMLWCWWLPCFYDDVFVTCDYLVYVMTSQVRAFHFAYTSKSLSVWVWPLPIGPKNHMQKGYYITCHFLLHMGGRGKSLSVWIRLSRAKRPHAKKVLHDMLSLATHRGIGKFLRVWVRLGRADKPQAKKDTYHANVFGFWPVCGGMSWWHFCLCGTLTCGLGWGF